MHRGVTAIVWLSWRGGVIVVTARRDRNRRRNVARVTLFINRAPHALTDLA